MTKGLTVLCVVMTAALSTLASTQNSSTAPQDSAPSPSVAQPPASSGEKFPWPENNKPRSASDPNTVVGSLAIRAVQGTLGGPPIVSLPIQVEILHLGARINTINTQIDEHGVVVIDNLPVSLGIQPIATIKYADLTYQVAGGLMDATHPQQQLDLVCYESTVDRPAWKVQIMHVMASLGGDGLHITEVIVIQNPGDRTWIGDQATKTKRVTTTFVLPKGAQDVRLGRGFHDWCCTTLASGTLFNHLPLMPDVTEMAFSYVIPLSNGRAAIDVTAPAEVDNLMVLVPESLTSESTDGLASGGTQSMGDMIMRSYTASKLSPGQRATITLAGFQTDHSASAASGAESMSKIVAMAVGGFILLVAVVIVAAKAGKNRTSINKAA